VRTATARTRSSVNAARTAWTAIVRHEARLALVDVQAGVVLIVMPLLLIAFIKPVAQTELLTSGYAGTNGAERAVPGMAVMFGFFTVGVSGYAYFREHIWSTWPRIRAAPLPTAAVVTAKLVVPLGIALAQAAIVFCAGALLFGLHVRGSVGGIALVAVALALCQVALGVALFAVCTSFAQLSALTNLGAIVLAGIGGAIVPRELLPGWVEAVAPATPTYWAVEGFERVVLEGRGVQAVLVPCGILLCFTLLFATLAIVRFDANDGKAYLG
jgi:ABC-2 type transport system permease protein